MTVLVRFFAAIGAWTTILLVLLSGISLIGDAGISGVLAQLPVWGGFALVLSAFPAGIAVAAEVFPRSGGLNLRAVGAFSAAAGSLSVVTFLLVAYLGPMAMRSLAGESPEVSHAATLTLGELRGETVLAIEAIEAEVGRDGLSTGWLDANILAWHYHHRLAGVAQPLLFAAIGVLLGFWGRRLGKRELASLLYWAVGLFLIMSTYLAGENSYELVVLQAAGPVFFAGLFVLIIPPVLAAALAIPTAVLLWTGEAGLPEA